MKQEHDININSGKPNKTEQISKLKNEGGAGQPKSTNKNMNTQSLVKYDTAFLVSTTSTNKKTLDDLDENNEKSEIFLRNLINKKSGLEEKNEYSVKDALNKILPPKKHWDYENDQLWVQYVSCTPVTKAEVLNLQEGLDRRLQTNQARETGICPIREELYNECFDELIRQVTINCLERGILLMRIKKEIEMTINTYQTLYESAIAYGIRTSLLAEEKKSKMKEESKNIEEECYDLKKRIQELEIEIESKTQNDLEKRKEDTKTHDDYVAEKRRQNSILKDEIKTKLQSAKFK